MNKLVKTIKAATVALTFSLAAFPSGAQDDFPTRPIRMVVPGGAGGSVDVITRLVADKASTILGQPVIVDNRPGAGGVTATLLVKQAAPDGYTLLVGGSYNFSTAVALIPNLGYDPVADFAPVTRMADFPFVLLVNPAVPAKNIAELVALARRSPGLLNYASNGNATTSHLSMELLKATAAIDLKHIPYRASAPAMADLLSGQVQLMFDAIASSSQQVAAGKLRAIGITSTTRSASMPDVPPIGDTVNGYQLVSWGAIFAPAGTPRPVIDKLNKAFVAALSQPEVREKLKQLGATVQMSTPEGLAALVKDEIPKAAEIVRKTGAKVD